jgi:hypothetical protein
VQSTAGRIYVENPEYVELEKKLADARQAEEEAAKAYSKAQEATVEAAIAIEKYKQQFSA